MAAIQDGPTVHFGATGYQDYTQHRSEERKKHKAAYLSRHEARETRDGTERWDREMGP